MDNKEGEEPAVSVTGTELTSADAERLLEAFKFTLTDCQRLLQSKDVDGICRSPDMCFEYSETVRCGPCAIKQSRNHGVEPDFSLPGSAEVYRLQRRLRAAETEVSMFAEAFRTVIDAVQANPTDDGALREQVSEAADKYHALASGNFDPALITLNEERELEYDGIRLTYDDFDSNPQTIVRKVNDWAMENLCALPGRKWDYRKVRT
jgi:hypothetical protein